MKELGVAFHHGLSQRTEGLDAEQLEHPERDQGVEYPAHVRFHRPQHRVGRQIGHQREALAQALAALVGGKLRQEIFRAG